MKLALTLQPGRLAIARLPLGPLPDWLDWSLPFLSVTRTEDEISVICPEEIVPPGVTCETGWQAFKVAGPLALSASGILMRLLAPLAEAGVGIVALSTHHTDYILVRDARVTDAARALGTVASVATE